MQKKVRVTDFKQAKLENKKLAVITCYDASFARLIESSSIDAVLVGDSLGNVVKGQDTTLEVSLEEIAYHCRSVSRGCSRPLLIADMPFLSYGISIDESVKNAGFLMKEGKAHSVKLESCSPVILESVRAMVSIGIPVCGHLGFTPQSVHQIGGTKVGGKGNFAREKLKADAKLLEDAGVFAIFLEMVPESLARELQTELKVPCIGIGAGKYCDGQVLVLHDMLGLSKDFKPKFLKHFANLGEVSLRALNEYADEVKTGVFPAKEHTYLDA